MRRQLLVAQEAEGLGLSREPLPQALHFLQPAGRQHVVHPRLDAGVKRFPLGEQPQLLDRVAFQGVAPAAEQFAARAARLEEDLERPDELGRIPGGDCPGRLRVHPRQQPVKVLAAPFLSLLS